MYCTSEISMRICGLEEQIHVIDNKVTVEEIIKDIVRTKVNYCHHLLYYFVIPTLNVPIILYVFF